MRKLRVPCPSCGPVFPPGELAVGDGSRCLGCGAELEHIERPEKPDAAAKKEKCPCPKGGDHSTGAQVATLADGAVVRRCDRCNGLVKTYLD
jgi:hypothetical protein